MATARPSRKSVSIKRLRAMLLVGLVIGVSLFTGVMVTLEKQASERFGPEVRQDLEWRALRGANELARAADIGLAAGDRAIVTQSFGVYAASHDVAAIVAVDTQGKVVAQHGDVPAMPLFTGKPDTLERGPGYLTSWMPATIEGVEVGKVAIVVSTDRLSDAQELLDNELWITLIAGGGGLIVGVIAILFFTRAMAMRDRQLNHYANNLEQAVALRTEELDERNREMRLVLDNVSQGFVMVDLNGTMASEHSAIVEKWFGTPQPDSSFAKYLEPHAADFALWFELALSSATNGMPLEICIAQMPTRFTLDGRAFELDYLPIKNEDLPERILVIISDVTERLARERSEREQRELVAMFQRIARDPTGVDELVTEVKALLATLTGPCEPVVERRILHTLKGNCAMFGLEIYSERCHEIETELAESMTPLSDAQRQSLVTGWRTVEGWIDHLRGAKRDDVIEVSAVELSQTIKRAQQGASGPDLAPILAMWAMEPVARRLDRLAQHSRGLARRLGKGDIEIDIVDNGIRLDGTQSSPFWAAAVHAIRNAIDHGLESADERLAAGKPATGRLTFIAARSSTATTITIRDDGRGIDWDAIREKARKADLPSATQQDLVKALFTDGVSTRELVSETSGRGVGMAALLDAVTNLGGTIDIESERNVGTALICRFPTQERKRMPAHMFKTSGPIEVIRLPEA